MKIEKHLKEIKKAIDLIELNLKNFIPIQDICAVSSLSPWQFHRLFRLYTSDSIGGYLRSRRLTCSAQELIKPTKKRILDVAIEYQFGSQEAYTRAFKKMFGTTPGKLEAFKNEICTKQKIKISEKQLRHNLTGIQRTPTFIDMVERTYVGLPIQMASPFYNDFSFIEMVHNLWLEFNPRQKEIAHRKKGKGYALILSTGGNMTAKMLTYVASVEVSTNVNSEHKKSLPKGMKTFHVGAQLYACLEVKGLADYAWMSVNYIYGFWLPQSGYKRVNGFDMKIFDYRMRLDRSDSISLYCIPVKKI